MDCWCAHRRHYGDNYKWLIWPGEDTVMFLPAIRRLLRHYDPELPLALSGRYELSLHHPN